jgi:hypothetical protein
VRAAASLCLALARAGGCALLLPGERRPTAIEADLAGWPVAHVRLALVDDASARPGSAAAPPPAPALARAGLRRGPLIYVSARQLDRVPPAARAVARGASALVVPGALPGRDAAFAVAGCRGYLVTQRAPGSGSPTSGATA